MTDYPKIPVELIPEEKKLTLADLKIGEMVEIYLLHSGFEVDADGVLWISKTIPAIEDRDDKPHRDLTICVTRVPEGLSALLVKGTKLKYLHSVRQKDRHAFLPVVKYEIL